MHRIDGEGAVASAPTPQAVGSTVGYFAAEGVLPATQVTGDWLNSVQEEIAAVAVLKGAALSKVANGQMATALAAVLGIEARATEAAAVDTTRSLVVIASSDADVGEDTGGVVHAAVIASQSCEAKGFDSAAIASYVSRAGKTDGSTLRAAVLACTDFVAEGDASIGLASANGSVTGPMSAMLAANGDGVGDVSGANSAAIASFGGFSLVGNNSAVIATDEASTLTGAGSAIIGGNGCNVAGDGSGTFASKNIKVSGANAAAIASTGDTATDEVTGANALVAATSDSKATGAQSAVLGGSLNEANATGSVVIGSAYSKAVSGINNVVVLASRGYESDDPDGGGAGAAAPAFSIAGGYDAGAPPTPVGRSWAIESNGGNMRSTNAHTTTGLDYAEYFANADGRAHEPGRLLARAGQAVRLAQPGDRVLGPVSAAPTVVGGDDSLGWQGRWLRDEWGRYVMVEVDEVSAEYDIAAEAERATERARLDLAVRVATKAIRLARRAHIASPDEATAYTLAGAIDAGVVAKAALEEHRALPPIPKIEVKRKVTTRAVNPAYDHKRKHAPRSRRADQFTLVALLGQVRVAVDASVSADDDVVAGKDGVGTRGPWIGRGAQLECMEITSPFDEARGYAIALCLVR